MLLAHNVFFGVIPGLTRDPLSLATPAHAAGSRIKSGMTE